MLRRRVREMLAIVGEQWIGPKQKSTGLQFQHLCEHSSDFITPLILKTRTSWPIFSAAAVTAAESSAVLGLLMSCRMAIRA
jgi:hypothetical protein